MIDHSLNFNPFKKQIEHNLKVVLSSFTNHEKDEDIINLTDYLPCRKDDSGLEIDVDIIPPNHAIELGISHEENLALAILYNSSFFLVNEPEKSYPIENLINLSFSLGRLTEVYNSIYLSDDSEIKISKERYDVIISELNKHKNQPREAAINRHFCRNQKYSEALNKIEQLLKSRKKTSWKHNDYANWIKNFTDHNGNTPFKELSAKRLRKLVSERFREIGHSDLIRGEHSK